MKKLLLFITLIAILSSCKSSSGKLHEEFKTKPTIFTGINVQIDTINKYFVIQKVNGNIIYQETYDLKYNDLLICDTSYLVDKTTITTHSKY